MNDLPRLIVITDWSLGGALLTERLVDLCQVGPDVAIQHRHPGVTVRQFYQEARQLAEVCRRRGNPLFINGQLDIALLLACHLHLPARGFLARDARNYLPSSSLISVAVHDEAEAKNIEGANIALVSPVFRPLSKPDDTRDPLGPEGFQRIAQDIGCARYALGGITATTAAKVPADGYGVIESVLSAERPSEVASSLLALARR